MDKKVLQKVGSILMVIIVEKNFLSNKLHIQPFMMLHFLKKGRYQGTAGIKKRICVQALTEDRGLR